MVGVDSWLRNTPAAAPVHDSQCAIYAVQRDDKDPFRVNNFTNSDVQHLLSRATKKALFRGKILRQFLQSTAKINTTVPCAIVSLLWLFGCDILYCIPFFVVDIPR